MATAFDKDEFFRILGKDNFSEALQYTHNCVPDFLCKWYVLQDYKSEENAEVIQKKKEQDELRFKSLTNYQNWFDTRFNQNDPFDMFLYNLDYDRLHEECPEDMIPVYESVIDLLRNSLLLCSFCDLDVLHLPMWANYANGHHGYCIKYRVIKKNCFYKMLYEPKMIKVKSFMDMIIHDAATVAEQKHETADTSKLRDAFYLLNNCKHDSWEYENEYRCLYPVLEGELKGQNVLNEQIGVEPVALYIGKDCDPDNRDRLIQIAHDVLKCKVYVCKISKTDFLSFEEC